MKERLKIGISVKYCQIEEGGCQKSFIDVAWFSTKVKTSATLDPTFNNRFNVLVMFTAAWIWFHCCGWLELVWRDVLIILK